MSHSLRPLAINQLSLCETITDQTRQQGLGRVRRVCQKNGALADLIAPLPEQGAKGYPMLNNARAAD